MTFWPPFIIGLVIVERAAELLWSRRNTEALRRRGAMEAGRRSFAPMVAVHAAWLGAMALALPARAGVDWFWIAVLAALQPARLWAMASLGSHWTTRIMVLPDEPLVRTGPYRFLRHPSYLVAGIEIAVAPLALREPWVAAGFFILNIVVMGQRIRQEEAALAPYRASPAEGSASRRSAAEQTS